MTRRPIPTSVALAVIGLLGSAAALAAPAQGAADTGDCYPPIRDPVSASYVAQRIIEVPGASYGPDLPTCAPTTTTPEICFVDVIGADVDCG